MRPLRIAILGSCQATTLYRIFKLLAPSIMVKRFLFFVELDTKFPTRKAVVAALEDYDFVFAQPFRRGTHPDIQGLSLREDFEGRIHFYPEIDFNAFHPDCVYVWRRNAPGVISSPIGDYHSALTFLGYSLGLTAGQTVRLFGAEVFEMLGYFQYWNVAEKILLNQGRSIGFPLEDLYRSWVRRGYFMNSMNHPKLFVMADLARNLLKKISFPVDPVNVEDFLPDESLFDAVWPLYPEIASTMSLKGAYVFKSGSRSDEGNPFLTLRDFVQKSYDLYQREAPGAIECQRVTDWAANADLVKALRAHALRVS